MFFSTFATLALATVASCMPTAELEERAPVGYSYKDAVLYHHNLHRANHSSPALVWDTNLETIARDTAKTCQYKHNTTAGGGGYGQNIAAGIPYTNIGYVISDLFYNSEVNNYKQYGQQKTDFTSFGSWGHFSQIVWKSTGRIGCATIGCPNGLANVGSNVPPWFTVCNYAGPGNYANDGQFAVNVLKPKGNPTIHANAGQ
ncbi:unnamed protein product [Zymoseptoria tritici ST99CH_1E4]|uniref:SCP domain-containing protein n=1 Tax=Zymoseptoria tritici ST99CH_1E4 TaxID=1276532 RepID=A0A2H1GIV6_ZYMTR|nr:unnamed protein product [Zymoseptoria tritici ST99CH_1E4]